MESENPGVEVSSSDVWVKAHTQEGGVILPSAQPYFAELQKKQQEIKELQDAGSARRYRCIDSSIWNGF